MKNIYSNIYKSNLQNLKKAKKILKNDKVIGIPTETVYGLAGNAYSNKAVKKIYSLKKRPTINPIIIHYLNLKVLKKDAIINNGAIIYPGDEVQVQGPEIMAPFGEVVTEDREAIILRASLLERLWTITFGDSEVMELCEFSFSEEATL